ncbi:hypothetical protein LINPERPRIM_LOCUS14831 [Linum perenne]
MNSGGRYTTPSPPLISAKSTIEATVMINLGGLNHPNPFHFSLSSSSSRTPFSSLERRDDFRQYRQFLFRPVIRTQCFSGEQAPAMNPPVSSFESPILTSGTLF